MFKSHLSLNSPKSQLIYSIFTLFAIPILIAGGALLISVNVGSNFQSEQKRKAEITNSVISQAVSENIYKRGGLEQQIQSYQKSNSEIQKLSVLKSQPDSQNYIVVASTNQNETGNSLQSVDFQVVTNSQKTISRLMSTNKVRYWQIITAIKTQSNEPKAVLIAEISQQSSDQLMRSTLIQSLLIGGGTVALIVTLLVNDVLFLEHALLPNWSKHEDKPQTTEDT